MKKPELNKSYREENLGKRNEKRMLSIMLLALSLAFVIFTVSERLTIVEIFDGDTRVTAYTLGNETHTDVVQEEIQIAATDTLSFTALSENRVEVVVNRTFPVLVVADGIGRRVYVNEEMLVGDLLADEGITLDEDDMINLPISFHLSEGDAVIVQRVEMITTEVKEAIPYETTYRQNSLINVGRAQVITEGEEGERTLIYADRMVDGVRAERETISNVVDWEPTTEVILVGNNAAVSDLDFGYALDANGIPIGYTQVLTNQVATAYNAPAGKNRGASGMSLYYGYAAVRADQIPYGTKMYVTSTDGSFVYGYCIAADTGVGLMQNVIDIDLYYETYRESQLHGRRTVNIYILP